MKCPACGTRLAKGATFCHKCYTPIVTTAAPSATSTTAASPGPAAPSIPVSVPIRRSRHAGRGPRLRASIVGGALALILAVLIVVVLLLTRPWDGGAATARAGTVSPIPLLSGDGSGGQWRLGSANGSASVTSAQTPGCQEGPCPGTMMVRFSDGSQTTVDDVSEIAEIGQVDPAHYLAAAGFCYLNCVLRVYAIDTAAHSVATVLDRAHPNATGNPSYFPMPEGACGFTVTYRGATYTARTIPDKTSTYSANWFLYPGDKACRSSGHNAGVSGGALGPIVGVPSPSSTATTPAATPLPDTATPTALPQDTATPTALPQDTPAPPTVQHDTPVVPTSIAHAHLDANILQALKRDMATRNYRVVITQLSYDSATEAFSVQRTAATVLHRGARTLLYLHTQAGPGTNIRMTNTRDIVSTGKHVCVRLAGETQFTCQGPSDTFYELLKLNPDTVIAQINEAATATLVGEITVAGQRVHLFNIRSRQVIRGRVDGSATRTMTGSLYTALGTNVPINEAVSSKLVSNRTQMSETTITWSDWGDQHLTIPAVPVS